MLPSQYEALPRREKAMIIAMIQVKMEADEKKEKEMKSKARSGKRVEKITTL